MRLEKLPFEVVLLVGRVNFQRGFQANREYSCLGKLKLNFGNKVVASCGARRIKRTPSWRSQNERPVKTGARVVLLGHTRHCFINNGRVAATTLPEQ